MILRNILYVIKTYAAVQIVNALCDKGYRCLVTSFMEIVKNLLSLNRENRQQYLDDICRHDLLVFVSAK